MHRLRCLFSPLTSLLFRHKNFVRDEEISFLFYNFRFHFNCVWIFLLFYFLSFFHPIGLLQRLKRQHTLTLHFHHSLIRLCFQAILLSLYPIVIFTWLSKSNFSSIDWTSIFYSFLVNISITSSRSIGDDSFPFPRNNFLSSFSTVSRFNTPIFAARSNWCCSIFRNIFFSSGFGKTFL